MSPSDLKPSRPSSFKHARYEQKAQRIGATPSPEAVKLRASSTRIPLAPSGSQPPRFRPEASFEEADPTKFGGKKPSNIGGGQNQTLAKDIVNVCDIQGLRFRRTLLSCLVRKQVMAVVLHTWKRHVRWAAAVRGVVQQVEKEREKRLLEVCWEGLSRVWREGNALKSCAE